MAAAVAKVMPLAAPPLMSPASASVMEATSSPARAFSSAMLTRLRLAVAMASSAWGRSRVPPTMVAGPMALITGRTARSR